MEINFTISQIILLSIFLGINFVAFVYMGLDKAKSRRGGRRIPEAHLLFLAICFCALGIFFGMNVFRHKTRKLYFSLGIPLALLQNFSLLYLVYLYIV